MRERVRSVCRAYIEDRGVIFLRSNSLRFYVSCLDNLYGLDLSYEIHLILAQEVMGLPFTQSINHTDPFAEVRTEVLGTPYKVIAKVIRKFLSCCNITCMGPQALTVLG